jgi:glutamate racemase
VKAVACPLFVPLVEEGWWRHPVAASVAREYLASLRRSRADTLVLGCTHYPLLRSVLSRAMGRSTRLIDSAEQTAVETEELLGTAGLRRQGYAGKREFFCSDAPARFLGLARRLLGLPISRVGLHPFDI